MASNQETKQDDVVAQELPAPAGWIKKLTPKKGSGSKKNDIVFISPDGEEIKNNRQLEQYLKSHPEGPALSEFYWGTGDTPRRSARLGEKLKIADAPKSESPKKKQKISSTSKGDRKKNGKDEATDHNDAAEANKEIADKDAAVDDNKEGADKDVTMEANKEGAQDVGDSEVIAKADTECVDKETTIGESSAVETQKDESKENTDPKAEETNDSEIKQSKDSGEKGECEDTGEKGECKDAENETPPVNTDITETSTKDNKMSEDNQSAEGSIEKGTVSEKPTS